MKGEQVYNTWKNGKRQIDVSEGFADELMNRVHQYEQRKNRAFVGLLRLLGLISEHPLAQAGLLIAGAIAGLIRVAFVVCMFLKC